MHRSAAHNSEIAGLRNLGPKSAEWPEAIGITTRQQLARVGAIEACRRLRDAGYLVTTNMVYAIEGALMDCDWRALPFEFRKHLRVEFAKLHRET
ncbi:MAG: TfoX/Sxy family protein [Acidobacteriales bacterium]|nr:TfoX/Sxy family protein [Terriglobales bacterium]